ncbi:hypothetical protein GCM10023205_76150 [Yinghuangia aomiensis]|uniref:Secreted protein n=1 Tax=Yinghuangia aomiensis TaxID=676205 RepID=A0ABP9IAE8_9ACTN
MSNQPKWAWWVVGIVIPLIGIVVSIQLATKSDSGGSADGSSGGSADGKGSAQSANTAAPQAAGNPGSGSNPTAPAAGQPAKVLAGPTKVTLSSGSNYVDLDGSSPVPRPAGKGADATVGFNVPPPSLDVPGSGNVLALAGNQDAEPTRDECSRAIGKNGTYTSGEMTVGTRYCLQTDEGHIAYLRVATVPTYTSVTFDVTVWE